MKSDAVKKGIAQSPQRSLLRALGLSEEELKKPLVGQVLHSNSRTSSSVIVPAA